MKKRETEIQEFCCITCNNPAWVSRAEIVRHLKDAHNITQFKGKRRGLCFLDGAGFYDNSFELTFENNVIVHLHHRGPK